MAHAAKTATEMENNRASQPPIETIEDIEKFNAQQQAQANEQAEKMMADFSLAAIAVSGIGLLLMFVAGILGLIFIYRAWCCIQPRGARTTLGKAAASRQTS
ncbi:MAG: hypothetical protein OSB05_01060 [Akkermansiaceae bacterium]|nr:hypothetical protein [Akkermansiaceae bacterium]